MRRKAPRFVDQQGPTYTYEPNILLLLIELSSLIGGDESY